MKTSLTYIIILLILLFCLSYCGNTEKNNPEVEMPDTRFELYSLEEEKTDDLVLTTEFNEDSGTDNNEGLMNY